MLLEHNLGIRRHVGTENAACVVDGHSHFEAGDVILFDSQRRDLGHASLELTILERLDPDARGKCQLHKADVRLVDLPSYKHFVNVTEHHNQCCAGAQVED